MRQSVLDSYQSNAGEAPFMRKWLWRALILSVLLHVALFGFFRVTKLERFAETTERLVPRVFSVSRLNVNPELLKEEEPEEAASAKKTTETPQIDIPVDKPSADESMEELRATPLAPPTEIAKPIVNQKPEVDSTTLKTMERLQENSSKTIDKELSAAASKLLNEKPKSTNQSLLKMADQAANSGRAGKGDAGAVSGYSNLDDLLGQSSLQRGTKISMPGGALFEYDQVEIKPDAADLMRKLGRLIQKNPQVKFSCEGHTDTIGSADYNLELSNRRAASVKSWLVQNMGIDPGKVEARGFGTTRLNVKPSDSFERLQSILRQQQAGGVIDPRVRADFDAMLQPEIQRQASNRRVEIVIKFRQ